MRSAEAEIVPMVRSDLGSVCSLENRSFQTPWDRQSFEVSISHSNSAAWVARHRGQIVGYLIAFLRGHELLIANLAVEDKHRRSGLASRLISHILAEAASQGLRYAVLDVRESNAGAINLYSRFGFRVIGKRRGYYSSPPEDGLIMYRRLEEEVSED
ncbi:MAG TPA: ribosomal protein S18-alanine N-acetyltransferase [Acidobacteriota bacterium]|nr:ribosomal protein S18-alanine N-acetyltransferase [Acidobacteriota bacterium]